MNKFFCIFLILLFISTTENVFSKNFTYDVNNVEIKSNINNSSTDKKITELAFKKAFAIFIDKTLLKENAVNLYKTKPDTIKDLVLTYQIIKKEKNDFNELISIFNIRFDPKKINNFLSEQGIPYADISNISLTVLPILIKDKDILLYEENYFYKNWSKLKDTKINENEKSISYNLALENIEDLEYIISNKKNVELIDVKKINSFNEDTNYILLIIYYKENTFKVFMKTSIENKKVDRYLDFNLNSLNENKSYEEAILILKKEIVQIWKEQNLIDVNTPSFLDFFLETKKNKDYLKLKSILDSVDIIDNYSVLEMTNEYSKIRIKYKGKVNKIKDKLTERQIKIKIVDNVWKLRIK